ncbi:hypothetical protein FA15DRAFT_452280 [Coprinopsis marcescibilis]|uniref:Uncharacterized protein n=1 Tax=Coprinopsis marcescibilis TaxID=230819 RepID=A0A5C3L662_COPMA|nr:hypothetical protein FA15DRAFT_452280 [Coprinopsis marcescibilis]
MYPLPYLPVVDTDISKMDSRQSLKHQIAFMKNALVMGLNNLHQLGHKIKDGKDASAPRLIEYAKVVHDILRLNVDGDEAFFTKRGPNKVSLDDILGSVWSKNPHKNELEDALKAWEEKTQIWAKDILAYNGKELMTLLEKMESPLVKGHLELVSQVKSEIISEKFDNEEVALMLNEHFSWLAENGDVTILLPYCTSHHDLDSSNFWPVLTQEGIRALPILVSESKTNWIFAPFDPITRVKKN